MTKSSTSSRQNFMQPRSAKDFWVVPGAGTTNNWPRMNTDRTRKPNALSVFIRVHPWLFLSLRIRDRYASPPRHFPLYPERKLTAPRSVMVTSLITFPPSPPTAFAIASTQRPCIRIPYSLALHQLAAALQRSLYAGVLLIAV